MCLWWWDADERHVYQSWIKQQEEEDFGVAFLISALVSYIFKPFLKRMYIFQMIVFD